MTENLNVAYDEGFAAGDAIRADTPTLCDACQDGEHEDCSGCTCRWPHPEVIRADTPTLDAAWRETEEALPEGWAMTLYSHVGNDGTKTFVAYPTTGPTDHHPRMPVSGTVGSGPTPEDALRALTVLLSVDESRDVAL